MGGKNMNQLMAQYHAENAMVPRGPSLKFSNETE